MSDFLSGLGGLIRGMQPLMGEEAKKDEAMNAFLLKSELSDLTGKQNEVLARIGREAFDAHRQSGKYPEFAAMFAQADAIQTQIDAKQAEADQAVKAAELKQQAEQQALRERTCPGCGAENEPGTKFCRECGAKLGAPAASFCPQCGAKSEPGRRFCGECGAQLG
jgi:ribosomal protein L40E